MSKKEYLRRYIYFIFGLYVISFGIALSVQSGLGVSPISSIPRALNVAFPAISLGQMTMIIQAIYLVIEMCILRKNFKPFDLLQMVIVIIFGYFIDFNVFLLSWCEPEIYALKWVLMILSMVVTAFGIPFEIRASVLILPVDGMLATIAEVMNVDFGKVKVIFDCIFVAITVVFSLTYMHHLAGVREGTIASAIFVGMISRFIVKKLEPFFNKIGLVPIPKIKKTT